MQLVKRLYGIAYLNEEERKNSHIFQIEYYKIEEETGTYGIEIVKKQENEEEKKIVKISQEEEKVEELLETLKRNKVTPIEVEYILEDLSYIEKEKSVI